MLTKPLSVCLLIVGVTAAQTLFAGVQVDFNDSNGLLLSENFATQQTSGLLEASSTGGLNDSGSLDFSGITASQIWSFNQSFAGNLDSWSASIYVKDQRITEFGFTTQLAPRESVASPANDAGDAYLRAIALATGNLDGGRMALRNTTQDTTQDDRVGATGIAIGSGWNLYQLDANYLGSDEYSITGTIFSADSTGGITGTIATYNQNFTNAELAADSDVYLYFGLNEVGGTLDNFSTTAVIPEPSTYALCLGTLAVAFIWLRRRKA